MPDYLLQMNTMKAFVGYARRAGAELSFTKNGHMKISFNSKTCLVSGHGTDGGMKQVSGTVRRETIAFFVESGIVAQNENGPEDDDDDDNAPNERSTRATHEMLYDADEVHAIVAAHAREWEADVANLRTRRDAALANEKGLRDDLADSRARADALAREIDSNATTRALRRAEKELHVERAERAAADATLLARERESRARAEALKADLDAARREARASAHHDATWKADETHRIHAAAKADVTAREGLLDRKEIIVHGAVRKMHLELADEIRKVCNSNLDEHRRILTEQEEIRGLLQGELRRPSVLSSYVLMEPCDDRRERRDSLYFIDGLFAGAVVAGTVLGGGTFVIVRYSELELFSALEPLLPGITAGHCGIVCALGGFVVGRGLGEKVGYLGYVRPWLLDELRWNPQIEHLGNKVTRLRDLIDRLFRDTHRGTRAQQREELRQTKQAQMDMAMAKVANSQKRRRSR